MNVIERAAKMKALRDQQKAEAEVAFVGFVNAVFAEFPALNRVVVRGYTPSFNDGDPCTHSHEVYLTFEDFCELNEYEIEEGEDRVVRYNGYTHEYEFIDGVDQTAFNVDLAEEHAELIKRAFGVFDEAIEDIFNTDFLLTWTRRDDASVAFEKGDYECGY
jgi:hypothetical protein